MTSRILTYATFPMLATINQWQQKNPKFRPLPQKANQDRPLLKQIIFPALTLLCKTPPMTTLSRKQGKRNKIRHNWTSIHERLHRGGHQMTMTRTRFPQFQSLLSLNRHGPQHRPDNRKRIVLHTPCNDLPVKKPFNQRNKAQSLFRKAFPNDNKFSALTDELITQPVDISMSSWKRLYAIARKYLSSRIGKQGRWLSDDASFDEISLVSNLEIQDLEDDLKQLEDEHDDGYDTETTNNTTPSLKPTCLMKRKASKIARTRVTGLLNASNPPHNWHWTGGPVIRHTSNQPARNIHVKVCWLLSLFSPPFAQYTNPTRGTRGK